jgi:hypothetical protein
MEVGFEYVTDMEGKKIFKKKESEPQEPRRSRKIKGEMWKTRAKCIFLCVHAKNL